MPSRILKALFLTFILASLAACAGGTGATGSEPPPPPLLRTAVSSPSLPEPALKPLPEPGVVMGLGADGVKALLGPPDYRRRDKPAEIWQYRNDACVLDLFLYSTDGAPARVNHMDFRRLGANKDKTGPGDRECFRSFLLSAGD